MFHVEVDHSHLQPFRGFVKVLGGYDGKEIGVVLHTASDAAWQLFTSSVKVSIEFKLNVSPVRL